MKLKLLNKKNFMMIIMLIPIFQPKLFTQYNSTTLLYIVFNMLELAYFLIYFCFGKVNKYVHWPVIAWIFYRMYIMLIMICTGNYGGILQWGYLSLMVLNLIFICEYGSRRDIKALLRGISYIGILLLFLNFITLIMFKRGIIQSTFYEVAEGDQYLLGIKTQFTTMMFPTIAASGALYLMEKNNKTRNLVITSVLVCFGNIFYKNISTAIIGIVIIGVMVIMRRFFKLRWNFNALFFSAIFIQILIVFFNIHKYFSFFIETYLHKDATLSSRVYIWSNAKVLISNSGIMNFLFGNGTFNLNAFVPYSGSFWQPHNQLLVWIYTTGVLGTCMIFMFLLRLGIWKIKKNEVYYYLCIISFTVLFLSVSEIYFDVAVCYVPFLLLYYVGKFYERGAKV